MFHSTNLIRLLLPYVSGSSTVFNGWGHCATESDSYPHTWSKKAQDVKECEQLCFSNPNCGYYSFCIKPEISNCGVDNCELYEATLPIIKPNGYPGIKCFELSHGR